jgi:hypothetical protein
VDAANPVFSSLDGVLFNKAQTTLIQYPGGRGGSYVIPNSVTSVGNVAFYNCTSLTSVAIGSSVTNIEGAAFFQCTSLTSFSVDAANPVFSSLDGVLFNKAQTTLILFPGGRGGSYVIPNSVTNIGSVGFSGCSGLTSVTIPNSATTIEYGAFSYCTSLTNFSVDAAHPVLNTLGGVLFNKAKTILIRFSAGRGGSYIIPNSVTFVRDYAFLGCTSVTRVTIRNSVTSLGIFAFDDCASLTSVTIGNGVTSIGHYVFYCCANLTSFTFTGNAPNLASDAIFNVGLGATVYYYYGRTGWGTTLGYWPAVMLGPPAPQIGGGIVGIQSGQFGFTISGVPNQPFVVEASTNLQNWQPVWTNTLSSASTNFTDPHWTNYPRRFYRVRSQ